MSIDVLNKLKELDKRVAKLETGGMEPEEPGEYLEYVSGKWYYKDNKVHLHCSGRSGVYVESNRISGVLAKSRIIRRENNGKTNITSKF